MKQKTQSLIIFIVVGVLAGAYFTYITGQGAVVGFDSYHYLRSAEGLIAGQGFGWQNADGTFEAMSHFPPGYPALLAGIGRLANQSPLDAARWAAALTGVLTVLLTAIYLWRITARWGAVIFGVFLTTLLAPMLSLQVAAMSEGLFFVLLLGFLLAFQTMMERGRTVHAIIAGLLMAGMLLTRYAAAGVLLAALAVILFLRVDDLKTWIKPTFWFTFFAAAPFAVWLWLSGDGTSRSFSVHLPDGGQYNLAWEAIQGWFVTTLAKFGLHFVALGALWVLIGLVVVVGLVLLRRPALDRQMSPRPKLALAILFGYLVVYPLFLWVSNAFLDASTRWSDRILAPWLFAASLWLIILVTEWVKDSGSRVLRWAVILSALVLCAANGYAGVKYARQMASAGDGLTAKQIRKTELMQQVLALPEGMGIYTNNVPMIYFNAGREVASIPTKVDTIRNLANPTYADEYQDMMDTIHAGKAVLVIFRPYSDKDGIYPLVSDLKSELEQVNRSDDGFFLK